MKRFIPLALLLTCAACSTTSIQTGQADTGKALATAQTAVATAAELVHAGYQAGKISKATVQEADKLVDLADDYSKAARCAYAAGDQTSAQALVGEVLKLAAGVDTVRTGGAVSPVPPAPAC
jgi:hypothetical protein